MSDSTIELPYGWVFFRAMEPPLDLERVRPYFAARATELVELARLAVSTNRGLYLHVYGD